MATFTLSTDADYVAGSIPVNASLPNFVAAGEPAHTFVLPGNVPQAPGSVFAGYTPGMSFEYINLSSNTQTFSAPAGYTIGGVTSIATGATTPTRVRYVYVGGNRWVGF